MRPKKLSLGLTAILATLTLANLVTPTRTAAQQVATLHSFNPNGEDGTYPDSSGTTRTGGCLRRRSRRRVGAQRRRGADRESAA